MCEKKRFAHFKTYKLGKKLTSGKALTIFTVLCQQTSGWNGLKPTLCGKS